MASMDEDGSLTLSWAEASWAPPGSKPSVSRAQFDAIDRNGDGEHSLSEFGVALDGSMAAALDGLFAANDLNPKDGKIDAERYDDALLWRATLNPGYKTAIQKHHGFLSVDADGDGRHSRAEVVAAVDADSDDRARRTVERADADGDGSVSRTEFAAEFARSRNTSDGAAADAGAAAEELFGSMDTDGDNRHSLAEVRAKFDRSTERKVANLMQQDLDGDGAVSFREFLGADARAEQQKMKEWRRAKREEAAGQTTARGAEL